MFNEYLNRFRSADIVKKFIYTNVAVYVFFV